MAPLKPVKKEATDHRIQHVLDFATKICELLGNRADIPESLETELESLIKQPFPLPSPSAATAARSSALDELGSRLWNAATNVLRQEENERDSRIQRKERGRLFSLLRVFGYLLVDAAHRTSSRRISDADQRIRTFKIGLKACRFCLDKGELELAMKCLERCSKYASAVEDDVPIMRISDTQDGDGADRQLNLQQLVSGYYLLRLTHAWKSDRFDMADHFFSKLSSQDLKDHSALAEKAADLFHEAGKSLSSTKLWSDSIKWCERAVSALESCNVEDLSYDAPELRLAITATLVEVLLAGGGPTAHDRAAELVNQLEADYGMSNRVAVSLIRFQILTSRDQIDLPRLETVVSNMIRLAMLTDRSFKIIMQTMHKMRRVSAACALRCLEQFVKLRLLPDLPAEASADSAYVDRLEKAVVTFVLFATSQSEEPSANTTDKLRTLFDTISQCLQRPFSAKATHAAQTLIWKKVGASNDEAADQWVRLLRHAAFESAGQVNKARIGRKAIASALHQGNTEVAREAFDDMPNATQNETMTRYLMFKVALQDNDYEAAEQCLAVLTRHADKDPSFLYASVLEAQQSNMRHIAVAALQGLIDKLPPGVHLPSLLRCTARLLISELEAQTQASEEVIDEVVKLFERAAANADVIKRATGEQWRSEIQWWSKNAYNLALHLCGKVHPEQLIRLLQVCIKFVGFWSKDAGPMHAEDVARRRLLCHFLCVSAFVVLARSSEEGSEYSLQCYSQARREIKAFMDAAKQIEMSERGPRDDISVRTFELIRFDLECTLKLRQWNDLEQTVQSFLNFQGADRWDSLADLVIVVHDGAGNAGVLPASTGRIRELLQKCINETWKKDKDIVKMSRWLRLAFTINLSDADTEFALKVVQQAGAIARKGDEGKEYVYPLDELSWLATMAFNKAVDSLTAGDTEQAQPWIGAALELARYADDSGALHANLTMKNKAAEARVRERHA